MSYTIDHFNHNPDPEKCRVDFIPKSKKPAQHAKQKEKQVKNDKALFKIVRKKAAKKSGRRKIFPKPAAIFFDGVQTLHEHKKQEGYFNAAAHKILMG